MMNPIFSIVFLFLSGFVWAQGFTPPPVGPAEEALLLQDYREKEAEEMKVSPALGIQLGGDVRLQSTVNPDLLEISPAFGLGVLIRFESWALVEEVLYAVEESRAGVFGIESQTLEWNQWGQYYFASPTIFKPYLGAAFGISQNFIETTLNGISRKDRSRLYYNFGVSAGMGVELVRHIMVVAELRGWKFEQKKDPIASGLLSLRFNL